MKGRNQDCWELFSSSLPSLSISKLPPSPFISLVQLSIEFICCSPQPLPVFECRPALCRACMAVRALLNGLLTLDTALSSTLPWLLSWSTAVRHFLLITAWFQIFLKISMTYEINSEFCRQVFLTPFWFDCTFQHNVRLFPLFIHRSSHITWVLTCLCLSICSFLCLEHKLPALSAT